MKIRINANYLLDFEEEKITLYVKCGNKSNKYDFKHFIDLANTLGMVFNDGLILKLYYEDECYYFTQIYKDQTYNLNADMFIFQIIDNKEVNDNIKYIYQFMVLHIYTLLNQEEYYGIKFSYEINNNLIYEMMNNPLDVLQ